MTRYEEEKEFTFFGNRDYRGIVPDVGTSLTIEYWNGLTYTPDESSPVTGPTPIYTRGMKVKITPDTGGFTIDEGH